MSSLENMSLDELLATRNVIDSLIEEVRSNQSEQYDTNMNSYHDSQDDSHSTISKTSKRTHDNDDEFIPVKKAKGKRSATSQSIQKSPLTTQNRFDPIQVTDATLNNSYNNDDNVNSHLNLRDSANSKADSAPQVRVPPIFLREKTKWLEISKAFNNNGIKYSKAKNLSDSIQIYPVSESDHAKMTKFLQHYSIDYHTFFLQSEKMLKVVIRGLPEEVPTDNIHADLIDKNFQVLKIARMKHPTRKTPMPLVFIELPRSEAHIYELKRCCGLEVSVEALRHKAMVGQCHRCQKFGHAQSNCHAKPTCVKCGNSHLTADCQKSKDTPPKCANCGGAHTASYRGCPKYPKIKFDKSAHKYKIVTPKLSFRDALLNKNATQSTSYDQPNVSGNPIQNATANSKKTQINSSNESRPRTNVHNKTKLKDIITAVSELLSLISAAKSDEEATKLVLRRLPDILMKLI